MRFAEARAQFAEAWLRVWTPDGIIEVRPDRSGRRGPRPGRHDHAIISAWNPGGVPADPAVNDAAHAHLVDGFRSLRGLYPSVPAVIVGADALWAQPAVAVTQIDRLEALDVAVNLPQPALIVWTPTSLVVIPTDGGPTEETGWTSRVITARPCPMLPPLTHRTEPCRMPGGPHGSDAINTAAAWAARRASLLRAAGCDICTGGRPPGTEGTPIIIQAPVDPAPGDTSVFAEPYRPATPPIHPW